MVSEGEWHGYIFLGGDVLHADSDSRTVPNLGDLYLARNKIVIWEYTNPFRARYKFKGLETVRCLPRQVHPTL